MFSIKDIPRKFIQTSGILWEGASMIDGKPIVVIAVGFGAKGSTNVKTGEMIQTYILRADVAPLDALKSGEDASICGDCKHRHQYGPEGDITASRTCYVDVTKAPTSVFRAFSRNRYARIRIDNAPFSGKLVRLGTYGDPAAVPFEVWCKILLGAKGHTGYTHQWKTGDQRLRSIVMASCDSMAELALARSGGWRSFIVTASDYVGKIKGAATCPASEEGGRKLTCATCLACHGAGSRQRGDIAIRLHGSAAGTKSEAALLARI